MVVTQVMFKAVKSAALFIQDSGEGGQSSIDGSFELSGNDSCNFLRLEPYWGSEEEEEAIAVETLITGLQLLRLCDIWIKKVVYKLTNQIWYVRKRNAKYTFGQIN